MNIAIRFLSFESFLPLTFPDSYVDNGPRCEPHWLACSNSTNPLAANEMSRRLRRQMPRTFALKRDLNRPKTRPIVRPRLGTLGRWRCGANRGWTGCGRRSGRLCQCAQIKWRSDNRASASFRRIVEVEPELETPQHQPPEAATLSPSARGASERQQAKPDAPASDAKLRYTSQFIRPAQTTPTIKMIYLVTPTRYSILQ